MIDFKEKQRLDVLITKYHCNYHEPFYYTHYNKSRSNGQKKLVFYRGQNKRKVPPITLAKLSSDK
jgi:hypothetical protein